MSTKEIPEELFDGYAVLKEIDRKDVSADHVAAVLDAVVRLIRRRDGAASSVAIPEQIADAILSASGEAATRIALRQQRTHIMGAENPGERDLGGLNRNALVRVIRAALSSPPTPSQLVEAKCVCILCDDSPVCGKPYTQSLSTPHDYCGNVVDSRAGLLGECGHDEACHPSTGDRP